MSKTTFGRVTVAGLWVALVVGCGQTGSGDAGAGPTNETTMLPAPTSSVPAVPAPTSSVPAVPAPTTSVPATPVPLATNPVTPSPEPVDPPQVAWVPPGPGNMVFPYDNGNGNGNAARWASAFDDHNCDAIAALGPERDQRQLYSGLGAACRAVLSKNDQLWTSAEAALQHVDDPSDCRDRSALRLLRDLVMAHGHAPRADIQIVDPPPGPLCGPDSSSPPSTSITPMPTPTIPNPTPTPSPSAPAG